MKAVILGTTGYTGQVLLRLLSNHPDIDVIIPVSSSRAGSSVFSIDGGLSNTIVEKLHNNDENLTSVEKAISLSPDVVFAALPHLTSANVCEPFFDRSVVVDLSADFRIRDQKRFTDAYGEPPPFPGRIPNSVYGLSELYRDQVKKADIIANPGCYPTATLLPIIPLLREGVLGDDSCDGKIFVNALSGISGAGKKTKENLLFCSRTENCGAYAPGKSHRHTTEIQQEVEAFTGGHGSSVKPEILFTPHLVPLKRGMVITTTTTIRDDLKADDIYSVLERAYAGEPFIKIVRNGIPQSVDVWGSNRCDIGCHIEGNTLYLFSVIDNLIKGASGQAVQNMNIRFGLNETNGLAVYGEV
jgi:N-acetyl-gamma-glutamyl-phosphate reductase